MPLFRLESADDDPLPPGQYLFSPDDDGLPPLRFSLLEPTSWQALASVVDTIVEEGGELPTALSAEAVAEHLHDAA